MTRAEHLGWAKERAHKELEFAGYVSAIASMLFDLPKHEGWRDPTLQIVLAAKAAEVRDPESYRRWVDGID